jgi:hypothetical protein
MRTIHWLMFVCLVCLAAECEQDETCEDSKMPEINFYFVPYGTKAEIKDASEADITGQVYSDITIKVSTYKFYCNGKSNGPFSDMYDVTSSGSLDKLSPGAMEYRMDNSKDMMQVSMVATSSGGEWPLNGDYISYKKLEPFDEGNYNLEFKVYLRYDTITKKIKAGEVTYIEP